MSQSAGDQDPSEIGVNQTKEIRRHLFSSAKDGGAMGATRRRFTFKCIKGHLTQKFFMLGTRIDDYDETTCEECLKSMEVRPAYIVCADFISTGAKSNGRLSS